MPQLLVTAQDRRKEILVKVRRDEPVEPVGVGVRSFHERRPVLLGLFRELGRKPIVRVIYAFGYLVIGCTRHLEAQIHLPD